MRTVSRPGFHAACGTVSSTWRRRLSTRTVGAGVSTRPLPAARRSAVVPCQVRNRSAGAVALAPCGKGLGVGELPSAIVAATRAGSRSVFRVRRKAVARRSGLTRSSTRSAALLA
jgi:hypothetical protein